MELIDKAGTFSALQIIEQLKADLFRMQQDIDTLEKLLKGEGNLNQEEQK
jgi:hypothetical protein